MTRTPPRDAARLRQAAVSHREPGGRATSATSRHLVAITDPALSSLPLDDFLSELLARAREATASSAAAFLLPSPDESDLAIRAASGFEPADDRHLPPDCVESLAFRESRTVDIADLVAAEATSALPGDGARLAVPLVVGGRAVGVLAFARSKSFAPPDLQLVEIVADRAAAAVENARLAGRLASAETDRLDAAFFRAFQREMGIGTSLLDRNLRFIRIDDRLAEMNGIAASGHIGRTLAEIVPDIAPSILPVVRSVIDSGQPARGIELSGQTPSAPGATRHWVASYLPVTGDDGVVIGVGCVVEEAGERESFGVAQRESESKYRTLLDNMTQRVIYKNRDSVYLTINPAYAADIGISPAEIVGKTDYDLNPPETAEKYRADDRRVMSTGVAEEFDEVYVVRGQTLNVHTVKAPVRDPAGAIIGVLVIFWDITGRKRAEERLRLFIEQTPLGVVEWDEGFRVVRWNPAAERIFGYAANEIIGKHVDLIVPPSDRAAVNDVMTALLAQRGGHRSTNLNVTKDGRVITCEWYNTTLTMADGRSIGIASLVDDITERIRARANELSDQIRLATLAELGQLRAGSLTVPRICETVLRRAVELTGSQYGYLYFYDEGTRVLTRCAGAPGRGFPSLSPTGEHRSVYSLDEIGAQADSIRRRQPIIANDYGETSPAIPDGHPPIARLMSLPVFDGDRIVAVVGAVNKPDPYDKFDLRQLELLMAGAWQFVLRTRGDEALRESEQRFRALFEQAAVGIVQVDLHGTYLDVNQRYADIVGRDRQELVGHNFREALHQEDLAATLREFNRLVAGEMTSFSLESRRVRDGGSTVWVSLTATLIRDSLGEPRYVSAVVEDISARKAAEAERERLLEEQVRARRHIQELADDAQRHAAELRSIFESTVVGIVVVNANRRITLVNDAASRILGMSVGEIEGLEIGALPAILRMRNADGLVTESVDQIADVLVAGQTVVGRGQVIWNRRTSRDVDLRLGAAPIRGADGKVGGAVIALQDVTALNELDRLKDQFMAVAAHELKTPVTIMKGYAQTLQRMLSPNLAGSQRRMLDAMVRGANRMDRTILDLLDVSQLSAGRLELKIEPVNLKALVGEAVDQVTVAATNHSVHIEGEGAATVLADPARIEQVVVNLLDNAIRYSPAGGEVVVRVRTEGGVAIVTITDQGVGIPSDRQSGVFERFYRAHTGTPYDYGGMGVSLYLSSEIVRRHGGRIWFESRENEGSAFSFSLPLGQVPPD